MWDILRMMNAMAAGTYTWKNGDKYKGLWKNDAMNGKGTYTWKNKNYVTGIWKKAN